MEESIYVTSQNASILKRIGFNVPTACYYRTETESHPTEGSEEGDDWNDEERYKNLFSAPEIHTVQSWFRNKFGIEVYVIPKVFGEKFEYAYNIQVLPSATEGISGIRHTIHRDIRGLNENTYEEALREGLETAAHIQNRYKFPQRKDSKI